MPAVVIWVGRDGAQIFKLSSDQVEIKKIKFTNVDHHTHQVDQLDIQGRQRVFFGEIAQAISGSSKLLIVGPGVAKHHFYTYLIEHVPRLAKRVVGCETIDHLSDGQVAAIGKKYFRLAAV